MERLEVEKADAVAGQAAAGALATVSGSLNRAGQVARRAGMAMRDGLRDSARAVDRGRSIFRSGGLSAAAAAFVRRVRRNKAAVVSAAGALTAGVLMLAISRRRRNEDDSD